VKYLGLQFDRRQTWKDHIAKKRKDINLKIKEINWLRGRKFRLSIENKVLIYKAIIKPICSYGIELWENPIQNSQSHSNAPWYVTNHTLHSDLKVRYVRDVFHERIRKHHTKLEDHPNPLLEPLLQPA
jgi:hypothetical protein